MTVIVGRDRRGNSVRTVLDAAPERQSRLHGGGGGDCASCTGDGACTKDGVRR